MRAADLVPRWRAQARAMSGPAAKAVAACADELERTLDQPPPAGGATVVVGQQFEQGPEGDADRFAVAARGRGLLPGSFRFGLRRLSLGTTSAKAFEGSEELLAATLGTLVFVDERWFKHPDVREVK